MCNLATDKIDNTAHIVVSTLGAVLNLASGRSKGVDLNELRIFVLDEADIFFKEATRRDEINKF